jgi:hypothetical protein
LQRVLGIFAKEPRPGQVKSRLAATIGADAATRLYDAFLRDLLPRLMTIDATRVLAFASPADHDFFRVLCGEYFELELQVGSDLGARMATFFQNQFARGASRVILVGSDSPDLPLQRIEQAFARLDDQDVVVGPSDDGGYYLVAMRKLVCDIFAGIEWSTANVFTQTAQRLRQIGVRYSLLEPWYDVDLPDDLRRLNQEIMTAHRAGRDSTLAHTEDLLRELTL